jgi:hypothetical protein
MEINITASHPWRRSTRRACGGARACLW